MNIRRLIRIAAFLAAVAALTSVALVFFWRHSQPTLKHLPQLVRAVQNYSRDHVSRQQPLPAAVTLQDLINGGYISAGDVRAFDGMEVTIYPTASAIDPQAVLVRVRMADGFQVAAMADGRVQELSK